MSRISILVALCLLLSACDATADGEGAPTGLVSPTSTQFDASATVLTWSAATDVPQFQLEIVRDRLGRRDTFNHLLTEPSYTERFGPGAFAWRVRSIRGLEVGAWSETAQFRFDHAIVPVSMGWFLSTAGLQPNRDYDDTEINPFGIQQITTASRSIDSLGLDLGLVTSARFDRLDGRLKTPEGATLDAFESYRIRTLTEVPIGSPVAELVPAPPTRGAGLAILDDQVPDAVLDGTGVRYRLRVRTGSTLPVETLHTFIVEGTARLSLDVSGSE